MSRSGTSVTSSDQFSQWCGTWPQPVRSLTQSSILCDSSPTRISCWQAAAMKASAPSVSTRERAKSWRSSTASPVTASLWTFHQTALWPALEMHRAPSTSRISTTHSDNNQVPRALEQRMLSRTPKYYKNIIMCWWTL